MEKADDVPSPTTIIVPGPELLPSIDRFAEKLSTLERQKADDYARRILASPKREKFLFIDPSHYLYPYFLQKLTEFREKGASARSGKEKGTGVSPTGSSAQSSFSCFSTEDGMIRKEGGSMRADDPAHLERVKELERVARKYEQDPHPSHYRLDLAEGTLKVTSDAIELIILTAQYVSKYGEPFLSELQAKTRNDAGSKFHFLFDSSPHHCIFSSLVKSYERILNANDEETETRLVDQLGSEAFVRTMLDEKFQYVKASLARRQVALLTDDELQQRLQWAHFVVVQTYTLADLNLDGPVPATAISQRQVFRGHGSKGAGLARSVPEEVDGDDAPSAKRIKREDDDEDDPTASTLNTAKIPAPPPVFMSSRLVKSST